MNYKLLTRAAQLLGCFLIGYVIAVACHLFVGRSPSNQTAVYKAYCSGREDTTCKCPEYKNGYGQHNMGWPFISGHWVKYPCGEEAATEQHDYEVKDPPAGFLLNIGFWTLISVGVAGGGIYLKQKRGKR